MAKNYKIAVIGGDGTGPEVIAEGMKVLNSAAQKYNFKLDYVHFDFGGERYLRTGSFFPRASLRSLGNLMLSILVQSDTLMLNPAYWKKGFFSP